MAIIPTAAAHIAAIPMGAILTETARHIRVTAKAKTAAALLKKRTPKAEMPAVRENRG